MYIAISLFAILKSWCVGGDMGLYYKIYEDISNSNLDYYDIYYKYHLEPLYYLINSIFYFSNFNILLFSINLFNCIAIYRFIKVLKLDNYIITLPIFIIFLYYNQNFFYIRQGLALSFIALGISFLHSKKYLALFFFICAPFVHAPSAIFFLCLIKIERLLKTYFSLTFFVAFIFLIYFFNDTLLPLFFNNINLTLKDYGSYIEANMYPRRNILIDVAPLFFLCCLYIALIKKLHEFMGVNKFAYLLLARGLLFYAVIPLLFSFNSDIARRTQFYFVLSLFMFGKIFSIVRGSFYKILYSALISIYLFAAFFVRFSNKSWLALMNPYITFFSCDEVCNQLEWSRRLGLAELLNVLN
jgi:hypothetical protein